MVFQRPRAAISFLIQIDVLTNLKTIRNCRISVSLEPEDDLEQVEEKECMIIKTQGQSHNNIVRNVWWINSSYETPLS